MASNEAPPLVQALKGAVQQYKQYMRWHGHAWRAPMPIHGSGRFRVGGLLPERVSEHAQRLELARRWRLGGSKEAGIGEVGRGARTSPQPHFGVQAARALVLGPEVGPEPAGRLLERCVAAWLAASEATLTMLWRLRRLVLARAILAARPLRRAW